MGEPLNESTGSQFQNKKSSQNLGTMLEDSLHIKSSKIGLISDTQRPYCVTATWQYSNQLRYLQNYTNVWPNMPLTHSPFTIIRIFKFVIFVNFLLSLLIKVCHPNTTIISLSSAQSWSDTKVL